uniref:Uncharacterized protein n=1 Tax=Tanacetum cinerariifolium TaxID=118510 RepID=A0A6L2MJP7_TANCI|nr:hypothetical protein [Tanacetum cinerariifolium]
MRVENLEQDKIAQALEITKLKQRVRRLEKKNKLEPLCLKRLRKGGIIAKIDADEDVTLEEVDAKKDVEVTEKDADAQERLEESQAHVYHIDLEHADKVLNMHDDKAEPAELKEVKRKAKQDNAVLRYQALKRKPQTEAHARKNMMVYLKNMAGFKMDFFKALIDRRKVIITEVMVRQALRLDDAKSIDCLPNEEIFVELDRMGVGKGFSGVDTLLFEGMLVPQQVNDDVADVVVDVAVEDKNAAEPTPPTHATTPPHQQELIPSTSQVAPTPPLSPHQSPMAPPSSPPKQQQPSQPSQTTSISMDLLNTLLETYTTLTKRVENLEQDKIAQALEITKLKQRVRRLEKKNKLEPSCLKRMRKVGTAQRVESSVDPIMDDQEDERLKESQAQVYHIDFEHADKVLITTAATTITDALITAAPRAARKRKGVVIRDPEETSTLSVVVHYKPNSKDKGKGILVEEPEPLKKQAQIEQDEAYARELEAKLNANID